MTSISNYANPVSGQKNANANTDDIVPNMSDVKSDLEASVSRDSYDEKGSKNTAEPSVTYPDGGWKADSVVVGCFLCTFTLFGMMDSVGAVESYVQAHQLASQSVSTVSWIFSIYMFIGMFSGIFVGPLYDTFGSQWLLLAGTILTFVGIFSAGNCTEVYQFILAYGICLGLGTGFMLTPAVSTVSTWFGDKRRVLVIGVVQAGGSLGGLVFPLMFKSLFPNRGYTWTMRIVAFFNLAIDIIGLILAKDRLNEVRTPTKQPFLSKLKNSFDYRLFGEARFVVLVLALFMNEVAVITILTYISSYAQAQGFSSDEGFNLLTILNGLGVLGSIIPSFLAAYGGTFNMMISVSSVLTLIMFIILLPFGGYKPAVYVFACIFGFCCASTFALTGATINAITENVADFGKRYGSAYAFVSIGSLISLPISGAFIREQTPKYYTHMVIFVACCSACASILFVAAKMTVVGKNFWSRK